MIKKLPHYTSDKICDEYMKYIFQQGTSRVESIYKQIFLLIDKEVKKSKITENQANVIRKTIMENNEHLKSFQKQNNNSNNKM